MLRHLPPLNGVRAFEAAARHLSFTRAADELGVTQSAVSHQIKALEERLEVRLFRRLNRTLLLTDEGQAFLPDVREALDLLSAATARLHRGDSSGALTVSVLPSFATRWLVPRLKRFRARHPDMDIHVQAVDRLTDFDRENVDVAIRYGEGSYRKLHVTQILDEDVFPVCSPQLLQGADPLKSPEDLRHHTLLHDEMDAGCPDWADWLTAAGVHGVKARRGPTFSDSSMLLQAAIDGQGIALGRSALAADELVAGRLVKPFDLSISIDQGYFLVCPPETANRPKIVAFRIWLLEEATR